MQLPPLAAAPSPTGRTWGDDARLAAPALAAVGLAVWAPGDDGVTICPFRNCTGMACPGCGLTRALAAFARGDWATSWFYHPFAVAVAAQVAVVWGLAVGRRFGIVTWQPSRHWVPALLIINTIALSTLWIVRWRLGHLERVL